MKLRKLRGRAYRKKGGGPNLGNRCKDYAAGCAVCEGWRFKDATGRFPYSFDELSEWPGYNDGQDESSSPG